MRLEIHNLNKSFNGQKIIENLNFSFLENKIYGICGESGCGKTTLLNLLSLIEKPDKDSEIFYDNKNLVILSDEEKRNFRLKNIGFIFQSFDLFNDDTVFNNIALVIDSISRFSAQMKRRKIIEVLKLVDLEKLEKKYVKDLSGGEKQRVAIARALVNNPKIIFADEPTGSLDETNSRIIFEILRKISANCTVICVSHDRDLVERYCDSILLFNNRKLEETKSNNEEGKNRKNFLMIERIKKEKGELSYGFIFRHFYTSMKNKKIRFMISSILLSISLFSIGLSTFLKEGISSSLKESFSTIINENTLILKKKNNIRGIVDYNSSSIDEVKEALTDYKSDIDYYGVNYLVNFENFFKDLNYVYDVSRPISKLMDGFNARSFNEFKYLKNLDNVINIFPNNMEKLMNDEVIISMNYAQMKTECEYLQIARSFESLGEYIKTGNFVINLSLSNHDWNYNDNVSFKVRGVIVANESNIYHTNNLFNEDLFEKKMMFPTSLNLRKNEELPWIMKKIYYLKTKDFQSIFLNKVSHDNRYKDFLFDSDNEIYSPRTCKFNEPCYTNKVYLYHVFRDDLPLGLTKTINNLNSKFSQYYYSTNAGYINLGTQLFSGFASPTYFSLEINKLNDLIDASSRVSTSNLDKIKIPSLVISSSATSLGENNVRFSTKYTELINGRKPSKANEIVISNGMNKLLGGNSINKDLFLAILNKSIEENGIIKNYFKVIKINIVGITNSEKILFYQDGDFSLSLFRDLFQFSTFNLIVNSIVYEMDSKMNQVEVDTLNKILDNYEFVNPLDDFETGINETMNYLEYILIALSVVTLISSISLILIINYIEILESKRDYAILFVLGYSFKEILKMQFINTFLPNLFSYFFGCLSIFMTSNVLSKILSNRLGITTSIVASYKPFLAMFIVIIILSLISVIVSIHPIRKINIAKQLH
jgi:ABC-type lipoprotein export system ATPase subunit